MTIRRKASIALLNLKYRLYLLNLKRNPRELVPRHFRTWSQPDHINRSGFMKAIEVLDSKPSLILETGTSAWGTDSTRLWDSYIRLFGGNFYSVDIRKEASEALFGQTHENTKLIVDDSVHFLENWSGQKAQLIYLDSWDLDLESPTESAQHGKKELQSILPILEPGSLILIDDTPNSAWFEKQINLPSASVEFEEKYGVLPGKGAFYKEVLDKYCEYEILHHEYSILIRIV